MTSIPIPVERRLIWISVLPFAVVSLLHLASKLVLWTDFDHATKPLLMPALAIVVVIVGRRARLVPTLALLLGVLLSWVGDITVQNLVVGLGFFLLAHIAQTVMLATSFPRRMSRWALLYIAWFVALLVALWPVLGAYRAPLALYGVALGIMAATATRGGALTAIGGAMFVGSDSLLAFRLFTPELQGPIADFVIMGLYLAAQALLAGGVLRGLAGEARLGLRHGGRGRQTRTNAALPER